jgi:hypothetical protein
MYTEQEYADAAKAYDVPVPSLKAIVEVEASGEGFLDDGRPKILFEAHHFGSRTGYKYNGSNPDVSVRSWGEAKLLYKGGAREYDRLAEAMALNDRAAKESASWGAGQVMGFNWKSLGYHNVDEFVDAMKTKEGQMDAMLRYCKVNNLLWAMRRFPDKDACDAFAAGYNGIGAVDVYSPKIRDAFLKHSGAPAASRSVLKQGMRGEDVKELQRLLGINPDGDFGPQTENAIRLFQDDKGIVADGIAGPVTLDLLRKEKTS